MAEVDVSLNLPLKTTSHGCSSITVCFVENLLILGSPGLVAFPAGGYLYVKSLKKTVEYMWKTRRYNKMVFYTEACESGSMYVDWSAEMAKMNVYAVSAATPFESSYAYYYDSVIGTYLGDLFSITYMEEIDDRGVDLSLQQHFDRVVFFMQATGRSSHPQQYGHKITPVKRSSTIRNAQLSETFNTYDVKLISLQKALLHETAHDRRTRLEALIDAEDKRRTWVDTLFSSLVELVVPGYTVNDLMYYTRINHECFQESVESFTQSCGYPSDYGLQYLKIFATMCELNVAPEVIHQAALELCH
ncbi:hypothetical protein GEMRC1_012946 [Eukaryota sp. GEM-RC1]